MKLPAVERVVHTRIWGAETRTATLAPELPAQAPVRSAADCCAAATPARREKTRNDAQVPSGPRRNIDASDTTVGRRFLHGARWSAGGAVRRRETRATSGKFQEC